MTADQIRIHLSQDKDGATAPRVSWPRREAERLFIGQPAAQAIAMTPLLFSLCAQAQSLAARLVLQQAAGQQATASDEQRATLTLEATRETLRKLLLDWSQAFDGTAAAAEWTAQWRAAQDLPSLRSLAEAFVYGEDCQHWLQRGEDGWLAWLMQGDTAPARWLRMLEQPLPGCTLLPPFGAGMLAAHLADWLRPGGPVWQGQAREVSALAREAAHLPGLLEKNLRPRARLLARLLQLARWLSGTQQLQASAACLPDGALALVDTARGPLLHLAALDENGRISRYRVVPPTLWHAHPEGVLRVSLGFLAAASDAEWQRQISLIDPCVAYSVSKETEYA
ncbi:hydrogenase maturation factor HoxV [Aquitalea magnusonii]|uniref:Hydrogenase maturation factor HoxV n=1 Tax=Aquitalea magnusonii TaxID=332411 RepID=A0A3G9GGI4_9NEIS|nr:hypothetical protein [Aquitalea magnusonii]BBF85953.1 hydrogenase maturation factor HoxV [Aquitalea magnusonii]